MHSPVEDVMDRHLANTNLCWDIVEAMIEELTRWGADRNQLHPAWSGEKAELKPAAIQLWEVAIFQSG